MIVGEPDNKKILFFQEIPKRIHLHSNCEKIKFLGRSGVRWTLRVMPPFIKYFLLKLSLHLSIIKSRRRSRKLFPKLASPALGFAVSNLKKTELETETETETQLGEQV